MENMELKSFLGSGQRLATMVRSRDNKNRHSKLLRSKHQTLTP